MMDLKNLHGVFRIGLLSFIVLAFISCGENSENTNSKYIDPTIGNVAPLYNSNRPVVHLPNQMIRVYPMRYDHLDLQITSFPLIAYNIITPQIIFSIKPSIGVVSDTSFNRRLNYDQDFEINRPWYYSTLVTDDDTKVEFTAGERTGIYRFTFPEGIQKNLLLSHCYDTGLYDFTGPNELYGTEFVVDRGHQQQGVVYMYGTFAGSPETGKSRGEKNWGKYSVGTWGGARPTRMDGEKAWISYSEKDPSVVEFRYAISFISREQAKENFKELDGISFEELKDSGQEKWEKVIGQINVEGGTEAQRRTFYTALYRCYPRMSSMSEGGKYFGYDKKVHEDTRPYYTDDYTWGNFLALHPLRVILDPETEADMLQSYVRMYQESGWMPDYPRHFGDRPGMFGFHSAVMFLDAYRKGVRNFDVEKAFEGMLKSAEQATMLPSRNGPGGALEKFWNEKGYYPALRPGEAETDSVALARRSKRSAVSITLGHSTDSWALSELARELGKNDIADRFAPKSMNYKNLWHAGSQFFLPKDADGNWIEIDPKFDGGHAGLDYYNENNGWIYMWNVQHDIEGLIRLMGGEQNFERRLDQLFTERLERSKAEFLRNFPDQTGLIGMLGFGNQATFFIPYLYNYSGSPWKTQKMTRMILDTWFQDNIFGVPGDEDGGAMSSVVVFSAMGFYPVKPGIPMYTITSPVFSKVTIDLHNGKTFTMIAKNCSRTNKYIKSATMNGKILESPWFSHEELVNGGTLVLEMADTPGIWNKYTTVD